MIAFLQVCTSGKCFSARLGRPWRGVKVGLADDSLWGHIVFAAPLSRRHTPSPPVLHRVMSRGCPVSKAVEFSNLAPSVKNRKAVRVLPLSLWKLAEERKRWLFSKQFKDRGTLVGLRRIQPKETFTDVLKNITQLWMVRSKASLVPLRVFYRVTSSNVWLTTFMAS